MPFFQWGKPSRDALKLRYAQPGIEIPQAKPYLPQEEAPTTPQKRLMGGLYCRVSVGEQSKFSMEAQEEQLRKYCQGQGIEVTRVYKDTLGRFTFEERPGLMQLLDDIEKKRINVILCTEQDRIAGEEGILWHVRYILKRNDCSLIAISEQGKVANELEELTGSILSAVAKFENKRKQLRCRRGIQQARKEGKALNRCPFGYAIENKGKRESRFIPDPEKSKIVIEIFNRKVSGQSVYRIARDLSLPNMTIKYILRNRFYSDGELYGKHTPLIEQEVYEKAHEKPIIT